MERRNFNSVLTQLPSCVLARQDKTTLSEPGFIIYDQMFQRVCGDLPKLVLVEERNNKFAHEAGVFIPSSRKNYFTSNYQDGGNVKVYATNCTTFETESLEATATKLPNANGACNYQGQVLFCTQGTLDQPSALILFDPRTLNIETILDNFYGSQFNSLNDVVVHHPTGDIWFTGPTYGWQQGFRPKPQLPSQVYRFRRSTGQVWCVADGFTECNGLCFSPDYQRLYVTDTGATKAHGTIRNEVDPSKPSTIYEYDVTEGTRLTNRRLFAYCTVGVPDGIKCDAEGHVYAGCGDGIHVWDPEGTLLGKIYTSTMVANFNFSPDGIWILAEERLYLCTLKARGALAAVEGHLPGTTC